LHSERNDVLKNIPITAFEAYVRVLIGYAPIIIPPFYLEDEGAWIIPLIYFCTCFWMIPIIAFTEEREQTPEAEKIIGRGFLPLGYLFLGGLVFSWVAYLLFGGGRW
jgi:hypothetical protein